MNSDAIRLNAEGTEVPLAGGAKARLRYSMKSVLLLEDAFGSLAGIQRVLEEVGKKGTEGPMIRTTCQLVMPGLVDSGYAPDDYDVLDITQLGDYFAAANTELAKAFPSADPRPAQAKARTKKRSPGPTSTTSLPSDMAGVTESSGS